MSNIAQAIGWKFNHQPGMRCKEVKGVLKIVEFPGGVPSKDDQNSWLQEYADYTAANPSVEPVTADGLFNALVAKGVLSTTDRLK